MKKIYTLILAAAIVPSLYLSYGNKEAKILFVGDMSFDRYIRQVADKKGEDYIFSCIDNFLKDSDMVVGNLESPITDNPSRSLGSAIGSPDNFVFTSPKSSAKLLAQNNIKLVNLGNNHTGNLGREGMIATKKYLDEARVGYFGGLGGYWPGEGSEPVYRTELGGVKAAFISYNEFGGESPEKVAKKIADEKGSGRTVFVYAHWGDEYAAAPERVKKTAALFARSGADFIIGSHPHVILPSQKIASSTVYYSLGNFIFDQYWNKEVSTGLVLELHIKGKEMKVIEHKASILRDGRTCLKADK